MNLLEATETDQPQIDENKNYLEELVGPGKKFATVEDLAKGKYISDEVIKIKDKRFDTLSDEYKRVRDENTAGPKLKEYLDKIETLQQQLTSRQTPPSNEENQASYDPKQLEILVSSQFQKLKQTEQEEANAKVVKDKLIERYGNTYNNVLEEQAKALGLTTDEVNTMAKRNPNLFIKTFDLNVPRSETFQTPPRQSQRSDNFAPRSPEKRDWNYYENLRKKDPSAWLDKKIAVQMEKDAQALGKDFYS